MAAGESWTTPAFPIKVSIRLAWPVNIADRWASRTIARRAVNVSLACQSGSLPVAWQLCLPQQCADDSVPREKASIPNELQLAINGHIALKQISRLMMQGAPRHCVLMDAGYGMGTAFRLGLGELARPCAAGVSGVTLR